MNFNIPGLIRSALPLAAILLTACGGGSSSSSSGGGLTYTIGGAISGLFPGDSVALLNNGGNPLSVNANSAYNVNSSFTFTSSIASGVAYAVTAGTSTPNPELCTVGNGAGTMGIANINNVSISCSGLEMFAGNATASGFSDSTGTAARFFFPYGVATDSAGNIFVADTYNNAIRKITPAGVVTTLVSAAYNLPWGVAVDTSDNLYVANYGNNAINMITPTGAVSTLTLTGPALNGPKGIVYSAGNLYVADSSNNAIKMITISTGVITTVAGSTAVPGTPGNHDATGTSATFNYPAGIAIDSAGNLYVSDWGNNAIRKITMPTGVVTTLAGTASDSVVVTGSANGSGSAASFYDPVGITIDSNGNLYVADSQNQTIRKITPAGLVSTVAGVAGLTGFTAGVLPGGLALPLGVVISGTSLFITTGQGVALVTNVP